MVGSLRTRDLDKLIGGNARLMDEVPDASVVLVVTAPPYFAGKEYEASLGELDVPATYLEYLDYNRASHDPNVTHRIDSEGHEGCLAGACGHVESTADKDKRVGLAGIGPATSALSGLLWTKPKPGRTAKTLLKVSLLIAVQYRS
jgi:hypothetical protein